MIGLRVTDDVHKALKLVADEKRWSMGRTSEEAVKFYLRARKLIKE